MVFSAITFLWFWFSYYPLSFFAIKWKNITNYDSLGYTLIASIALVALAWKTVADECIFLSMLKD